MIKTEGEGVVAVLMRDLEDKDGVIALRPRRKLRHCIPNFKFWALAAKAILSLGLAAPEPFQFSYGLSD